jgi:hypothetical protein
MSKNISVSLQDLAKHCDWTITEGDEKLAVTAIVDTHEKTIKFIDGADFLKEYEPKSVEDYYQWLEDFESCGFLSGLSRGGGHIYYNNDIEETSTCIFQSDVAEIIGDIKDIELRIYNSFNEMELDQTLSGFSFSYEPVYEKDGQN